MAGRASQGDRTAPFDLEDLLSANGSSQPRRKNLPYEPVAREDALVRGIGQLKFTVRSSTTR